MSDCDAFLAALRQRESSGNYQVVNTLNFLGAYQFGEAALIDLGFVRHDGDARNNDYSGGWTGKCGVYSTAGFLKSVVAQDQAANEWLHLLWRYIEAKGLEAFAWTVVGGATLTPSSMLAAAHLMGVGKLQQYIESGGAADFGDAYGTPLKSYITHFADYDIPFAPAQPSGTGRVLKGKAGDDTLMGTAGDDRLLGHGGNDVLRMDAGDDLLDGGSGIDWVRVSGSVATRIDLAVAAAQDTGHGRDSFVSIENVSGGSAADTLLGNAGANILRGGGGNDRLKGRGGDDDLRGGAGNDQVSGGPGNDVLTLDAGQDRLYAGAGVDRLRVAGSAAATIDLARVTVQATGYGNDIVQGFENVLGGSGADRIYGGGGANILKGAGGADRLHGRGGADRLVGGLGQDTLFGGADDGARDVFVFNSAAESAVGKNRDVIYDFESGIDVIRLSGIDADRRTLVDDEFSFGGTTARAHSVWYAASRSDLIVRADVNGDKAPDFEIRLADLESLPNDDFIL